jgi:hypothetical protein
MPNIRLLKNLTADSIVISNHSLSLRWRALAHHLQERMGTDSCSVSLLDGRHGKLLGRSLGSAWRRLLGYETTRKGVDPIGPERADNTLIVA